MITGVLCFLVRGIESTQSNPKKLKKLDRRIDENAEHGTHDEDAHFR